MPNSKTVRSFKKSGMSKNDGGVPSQGLPHDFNSTYPCNDDETNDVPVNEQYKEKLPSSPTPIGSVNLGPVSQGGK